MTSPSAHQRVPRWRGRSGPSQSAGAQLRLIHHLRNRHFRPSTRPGRRRGRVAAAPDRGPRPTAGPRSEGGTAGSNVPSLARRQLRPDSSARLWLHPPLPRAGAARVPGWAAPPPPRGLSGGQRSDAVDAVADPSMDRHRDVDEARKREERGKSQSRRGMWCAPAPARPDPAELRGSARPPVARADAPKSHRRLASSTERSERKPQYRLQKAPSAVRSQGARLEGGLAPV
jgi:hypothetical protein